jgi:catalase-peroxidase
LSDVNNNRCPVIHGATAVGSRSIGDWWPNQLNLKILQQNSELDNPLGEDFDCRDEIKSLNVEELKRDIEKVMTDSKDWWPADWGNYGPLFIRMAWHSAGTYRVADGRGGGSRGAQRFAPVNSWPDNVNLDKARRLLWPIKQKYGTKISWADLIIFAGNTALEAMGFKTFGFGFGRQDIWEPPEDTYWGPEDTWLGDERYSGDRVLANPFAAVQMGLIYVNPEGPNGEPDPIKAAKDIRETFARMAMNDLETVALIAGGHTFGKTHGAVPNPEQYIEREPEAAGLEEQGLGWRNSFRSGKGADTCTSGLEGAWTNNPTRWDNGFFENLFKYEWILTKSPSGANQWIPKDLQAETSVPDAHDPNKRNAPIMLTTDIALKVDPIYEPIAKRFYEHPQEFEDAFAKAWYKLIHRDMGPVTRYLGPLVPKEPQLWQDPVPQIDYELVNEKDISDLKAQILKSGLSVSDLIKTAWASAATYRGTDRRGGANGARSRLLPQKQWEVNEPKNLARVLNVLEAIKREFDSKTDGVKRISLADLIVLGGCAGLEKALRDAGSNLTVPFIPGRADAITEQTDIDSFVVLEPTFDGFRNYVQASIKAPPEHLLLERACLLTLNAVEMTVLVGGLRVLGANFNGMPHGVFTNRVGVLTNDFYLNLLDMSIKWSVSEAENIYEGFDRKSGILKWTATRTDLVFGSNSQLRAIAEIYAMEGSLERFQRDFIKAWVKVMNADRFDLI